LLTRANHLKTRARIELHRLLLERMNSAQEIVQLMQTEEGRQFLEALSVEGSEFRVQSSGFRVQGPDFLLSICDFRFVISIKFPSSNSFCHSLGIALIKIR